MTLLLVSLVFLVLGPIVYRMADRARATYAALDGFVMIAISGLVLVHIIPHSMAATGGWAIALALWGAIVVGSVDNLLRPLVVGRDARLPDLVVLVSVLGGIAAFGAIGLVLGPILAALVDTQLEIYRRAFAAYLPPSTTPAREAAGAASSHAEEADEVARRARS